MNPVNDEQLALFVVSSHMKSHPNATADASTKPIDVGVNILQINQNLLRKYILYARTYVKPLLQNVDIERVMLMLNSMICESSDNYGTDC